jgi:hypothetical protein
MVAQLVRYRTAQQESRPIVKPKQKDNDFLSSRFLKVFGLIVVIKVIVLLVFL